MQGRRTTIPKYSGSLGTVVPKVFVGAEAKCLWGRGKGRNYETTVSPSGTKGIIVLIPASAVAARGRETQRPLFRFSHRFKLRIQN